MVVQSIGCFDRIQEYYNNSTSLTATPDSSKPRTEPIDIELSQGPKKQGLSFASQSFSWSKSGPAILKDLDVVVRLGTITAVVGPVGSGKSTFLESVLGETIATSGPAFQKLPAYVAYCSQQPWLENKTVRRNIIGTSPFDAAWYQTVVQACSLEADLRLLEKGDQTRIGSNGLNLSGGQKQRVVSEPSIFYASLEMIGDSLTFVDRPWHELHILDAAWFFLMIFSVGWMHTLSMLFLEHCWVRKASFETTIPP